MLTTRLEPFHERWVTAFPFGCDARSTHRTEHRDLSGQPQSLRVQCASLCFLDPAPDTIVHERPHCRRPSFKACAGGFAFLQGHDELDALAVGDIEHAGFPGVERGDSGVAGDRFVLARLVQRAEPLTTTATAPARAERRTAPITALFRIRYRLLVKAELFGAGCGEGG